MAPSKPWHKSEWKKKSTELVRNRSCAICGNTHNLEVHHIHETRQHNYPIEKEVIRELINKKACTGEIQFEGRLKNGGYWIGYQAYKEFVVKYRSEIIEEAKKHTGYIINEPDYTDLDKETIILCNKCHFAWHKGMILCKECGKLRHMIEDTKCRECRWRDQAISNFFKVLDRVVTDPWFAEIHELEISGEWEKLDQILKRKNKLIRKMIKNQKL